MERMKEIHESKRFIYCIKLPGFECHTNPPLYTMIKVGISKNPAKRLHEIMRGLEGFGVPAEETQFKFISEGDPPDVYTAEKCMKEDNVIFIEQCHSVQEHQVDYEIQIRSLIAGNQGLDERFREEFENRLRDDKARGYMKDVGITEWVLAPTALIEHIKCFRPKQNPQLFGCRSAYKLFEQVSIQKSAAQSRNPILLDRFLNAHNVTIRFLPTGFAYVQHIPVTRGY